MGKTNKELLKELLNIHPPDQNIDGLNDLNNLKDKKENNNLDNIGNSEIKEGRNDFNISELFESGFDFQNLLNLCNKIIDDFGDSLKNNSAIENHIISSDHIKTDLDRILEIELKNLGVKFDKNDLINTDYKLLSELLENKYKDTEFFSSGEFKKFIKSKFDLSDSENNINIEELKNNISNINKINEGDLGDISNLLKIDNDYKSDMDLYTLTNLNKRFKASPIENYWLENRENMFKNIPKPKVDEINDLLTNVDSIKITDIFQRFGHICKIEDGKIILDFKNTGEILKIFKDIVTDITPEQVSLMGKFIPTVGTFIFYKKINNLFADQLLRQEKLYLDTYNLKNKQFFNDYLKMVSDNRVKLTLFNVITCICIGGMLSAYIVTINRNIEWKISIPTDTENNKSFIPLFLLNKIKSFKLYKIGMICFIPFLVNYFSKNLIFISTIFIYLSLIVLGFIICYILYTYIRLYILNYEGDFKEHKLIKKYPFLYTIFLETYELQRSNDDLKKFFINHYHGLIIFYLSCIIILLFFIPFWIYIVYFSIY